MPWLIPPVVVLLSQLQVGDLAYQLRAGDIMWATRSVLRTDVFTYTIPGFPWLDQQWGAQLLLSRWFSAFGWRGLLVFQALILCACFGATYRRTVANGASAAVASAITLACFGTAASLPGAMALRPQLLALPLFVASAWIIERRAASARLQLLLVPIGIAWANIHGSFVLLTVLLGIALSTDAIARSPIATRTAVALAASLATPLISPWGAQIYRYVWELARSPIVREAIAEWRPLPTQLVPTVLLLGTIAGGIAVAVRRGRRPTFEGWATILVFTGLGISSGRNLLWWAVAVPPVVGASLAGWQPGGEWAGTATRVVRLAAAAVVFVGVWRVATMPVEQLRSEAPPGVTSWLSSHPTDGGRVFAEWWGGWFEFAVPEERMFVDARVELFPEAVWTDYGIVVDARPGWRATLTRWNVSIVVVNVSHELALRAALAEDPCWELTYQDGEGAIYQLEPGCS